MDAKILVVGPGYENARYISQTIPNSFPAAAPAALTGRRFHTILVFDVIMTERVRKWLDDVAVQRMLPGCRENVFYRNCPDAL